MLVSNKERLAVSSIAVGVRNSFCLSNWGMWSSTKSFEIHFNWLLRLFHWYFVW